MTPLTRSSRHVRRHVSKRPLLLGWTVVCAVAAEVIVRIHG